MSEIKIVKLTPMRVASAWGFGPSPEGIAWGKLAAYAESHGLFNEGSGSRVFGFNNPNPSEGSPNYGYEFWVTVGEAAEPEGDIRILNFPGGLYAIALFEEPDSDYNITVPAAWQRLDAWVHESGYQAGGHQWLEEATPQGKLKALCYPIRE
jgi:DNA gyrase inhibitor GyrI